MKYRGLRPEEIALWEAVKKTAAPLSKSSAPHAPMRRAQNKQAKSHSPAAHPKADFKLERFRVGENATAQGHHHQLNPSVAQKLAAAPLRMDHSTFKKMSRGKIEVEGRIDLHGMTLDQAYGALANFIISSRAQGKRLVLVITGKGKDSDTHGPIPRPRGVLRHQVPAWLQTGPAAHAVQQVSPAHARHGGSGAYYVYLRKAHK